MQKKRSAPRVKPLKSKIKRVAKTSISDDIVDQIMSLIANGDLKPGQQLPSERELCKNFGAGRSSLREALRCLSIVGVLTARVGEGTSVALDGEKFLGKIVEWRIITEKHDVENLMEVRIALESVTAANVARRGNEKSVAKLDKILAKMQVAVEDQKRFAALDLEFHVTLAAASENFLIYDLVSMIRGQFQRALAPMLMSSHGRSDTLKEHLTIVNAIRRHDPDAATKSMQTHLAAALKRYQNALNSDKRPQTKPIAPIARRA